MTAVQHLPSFDGRSNFHRNGPGYNGFGGGNARGGGGGGGGQGGYGQHHIVGPADRQQQFFGYAAPLAPLLSNRTHYDSSSSLNYQQPLPAFYPTYSANHSIAPPRSLHPSPQISNNGQHFVSDYAPLPRYSSQLPPLSSHHQQSALSRQNHDSADYNRRPYSNTRSSSREFDGPRGSEMRRDQSRGRGDDRLYEAGGEVRFSSVGANQGGGNHRYRPEVEQNRMSRSLSRFNPGSVASRESYETLGRFQAHPSFVVPYGRSVALVDHDHPSFDRPPCAAPHSSALPNGSQYSTSPNEPVEYQLVSNMNPVPPPPPIEKSAVPLADLATELIWDACRYAATSPSSDRSISSLDRWSGRRSSMVDELPALRFSHLIKPHSQSAPQTPELFGAVGEGRRRRQRQASSSSSSSDGASDVSSPSSSSPGTPGGSLLFEAVVAKKSIRLGGLGLDFEYEEMKADEMDAQVRKLSHLPPPPPTALPPTLAPEPSPAFRQFVKQVLTATLLAPEDLVLAVRYIASLPLSSMIPPTTSSRKGDAQASAVKAAPFKLVLGGLMLANKVRLSLSLSFLLFLFVLLGLIVAFSRTDFAR